MNNKPNHPFSLSDVGGVNQTRPTQPLHKAPASMSPKNRMLKAHEHVKAKQYH